MHVLGYTPLSIENSIITCTYDIYTGVVHSSLSAVRCFLWVPRYIFLYSFLRFRSVPLHNTLNILVRVCSSICVGEKKKRFMYFHFRNYTFSLPWMDNVPIWQRDIFVFLTNNKRKLYSDARHFIVFSTLSHRLVFFFLCCVGLYVLKGLVFNKHFDVKSDIYFT